MDDPVKTLIAILLVVLLLGLSLVIILRQDNQEWTTENEKSNSKVIPTPSVSSDPPYLGPVSGNAQCISLLQPARPIGFPFKDIYTSRPEFIGYGLNASYYFQTSCAGWYSSVPQMNPIVVRCEYSESGTGEVRCPTPRRGSEVWLGHPYNFIKFFGIARRDGLIRTFDKEYVCENSGLVLGSGWKWYCWNNGAFVGLRMGTVVSM